MPKKQRTPKSDDLTFPFVHHLLNQLAVIIGRCDLLMESLQDPEQMRHVEALTKTAKLMAEDLKKYQKSLEELKRAG